MPKSHRYFPWANGTNRASLSAVPPSRTGSIACGGGWWWGPRADYPVWPRFDRAWDGGKSRSRRQRSKAPCSFDLGSGGVFFQATPKAGHSLVAGLKITVDWTFQNKAPPLQPVACLARVELAIPFLAQTLHYRLTTQAKHSADGRSFPPLQKQKESGNPDSHPSSWDRVGHAEQRFACNSSVRNLERFHA